jgi:hypothetical protein
VLPVAIKKPSTYKWLTANNNQSGPQSPLMMRGLFFEKGVLMKNLNSSQQKTNLIVFILLLILTVHAKAQFSVEPMLSYQQGYQDFEYDVTVPVFGGEKVKSSINGWGVGLGFTYKTKDKLTIGTDVQMHYLNVGHNHITGEATTSKQYSAYLTFGYDVSPKFNAFFGLGAMRADNDTTPKSSDFAEAGKIGLVYYESPKYVGFVELVTFTLKNNTTNGISTRYDEVYSEYIYNVLSVGVKVPFSF